ncbi:siderophore-interacting protein [Zoogloea sp. LCSB751]|uniref:siderophore-interacting protein n=1 Tax=Zoogloea sp. LCSB751 TaxID=1965277 RepID=UPI0009A555DB|nr:siderophore-interacting protein [Zoogloea sp. LCSB751]
METTLKGERRIQRVRHELRRREVTVAQVEQVSPGFVRVTFGGDDLADFVSLSFDDHVKFMFADPAGEVVRRDYTPLQHDAAARTLSIEFALHERGAASDWARAAQVGQLAAIGGPRGSMIIPLDYDWHLLVGDSSALPAIQRRLWELPAGARTIAVIQVDDAADRRDFASAANVDVSWVRSGDELLAAVRALQLPAGSGFAWGAGETGVMRPLRELLKGKGVAGVDMRIAAYWKHGAADFHERLDD